MRTRWIWLAVLLFAVPPASAKPMDCDCGDMEKGSWFGRVGKLGADVASSPFTWGGLGVALVGIGGWGWKAGWIPRAGGIIALWSRFEPDELEEHPSRSRILHLLQLRPGATTRDLTGLSELNPGTLLYHLEILSRSGLVKSQRMGRDRAWYLSRGAPPPDLRRQSTLAIPARQTLLRLIQAAPGSSQADLARGASFSPATVHHHLQAMAQAGLVEFRRDGSVVRCFPASTESGFGAASPSFRPATPAT